MILVFFGLFLLFFLKSEIKVGFSPLIFLLLREMEGGAEGRAEFDQAFPHFHFLVVFCWQIAWDLDDIFFIK